MPAYVEAFVFTQIAEPQGWNPARYGHFEAPLNVLLLDKVPSANRSNANYRVVVLYRPYNLPTIYLPNNWMGYPGDAGYIRFDLCLQFVSQVISSN